MPESDHLQGFAVRGIAAAVPRQVSGLRELTEAFGNDARRIAASVGVTSRHIAPPGSCSSDLCFAAATRLLEDLQWERDSVTALVMVTQTPDYFLPATACVLHGRLGLAAGCAAFDVNLGCSGYVYGLWLVARLLGPHRRRALLLAGDTISKLVSQTDRSVVPLFGDGGTATAIEWTGDDSVWVTEVGTDGSGALRLLVPAGGFRCRPEGEALAARDDGSGNLRADVHLQMDGAEVMAFTLKEVPPLVSRVLAAAAWSVDDLDWFVPHQANRMMLQQLSRRAQIPFGKLLMALEHFGNTSSASIPLTLVAQLRASLTVRESKLLLAGFGVGFSSAAIAMRMGPIAVSQLIEL